ncbi:MAG: nucleotidyltransferase domain-containing protein [Actinomycetota bacterium]|nr:nucleotidyltransferase domain-containing protein [Actinomycetota bacterium]
MAPTVAAAALTEPERRALDRLVASLERELRDDLHAVWLYGSRARGEWREGSDVDVLVIASVAREQEEHIDSLVEKAAEAEGLYYGWFSVFVHSPEWLADRRAIEAWFIQAVDRDKVVLWGGEVSTPPDFSPRVEDGPVRLRTQEYMRDALEKLEVAKLALGGGYAGPAIADAYYVGINAAEAVLSEADRHVRTHGGRWHLVRQETVDRGLLSAELHRRMAALQKPREQAHYGPGPDEPFPHFTIEEARAAVETAERYLRAVEELVGAAGGAQPDR